MWFVGLIAALVAIEARWIINPFTLEAGTLSWCFSCCGWGQEPHGYECNVCFGQGFRPKPRWFVKAVAPTVFHGVVAPRYQTRPSPR